MDFAEILALRIREKEELKNPINALVCFSRPETGKALVEITSELVKNQAQKPTLTILHLIDEEQAAQLGDIEGYRLKLVNELVEIINTEKILIKSFVKVSSHFVDDILDTSEQHNCNIIMLGMGSSVFNASQWDKYKQLKMVSEGDIQKLEEMMEGEQYAQSLKNVASLFNRNPVATGVFINNNFLRSHNIFVPILTDKDIHLLPYVYQFALRSDVKITIWDAIGITSTNADVQKLYQHIVKKTDNKVGKWDNDKKIGIDFIQQQDLVVIGNEGWERLIGSALVWVNALPSTFIIKDKMK